VSPPEKTAGVAASGQSVAGSVVFGDVIQIQDVTGDVTISTERPPYRVEPFSTAAAGLPRAAAQAQPSRLLLARHAVVPFVGRENDVRHLSEWLFDDTELVSVRLVHAAGGQGKTRLAAQIAAGCAATGWVVWRVNHGTATAGGTQVDLPTGGGVLVVVDYADRWPVAHLLAVLGHLQHLATRTGVMVRALLLARSAGFWWPAVADRLDSEFGIGATAQPLPPLGDQVDRAILFTAARQRFADRLDVAGTDELTPPAGLDRPGYTQVLAVHMAALAAVDAHRHHTTAPTNPHAVSAYLLRREYAYWQALHTRAEDRVVTAPAVMRRAVYVATLAGALPRHHGQAALALTRLASTPEAADQIIDNHRACYPPENPTTVLEPLHPNRLGEDFLALTTPGHPYDNDGGWLRDDWAATAPRLLLADQDSGEPPPWTTAALTVLVETARHWPHISTAVLFPLLRERPHLAIAAGDATLTRLADLPDIDLAVLEAIETLLPTDRHVEWDIATAAVTTILTNHRLTTATDPADRARLHAILAWRLSNAGRRDEALTASREAADLYRRLAETDPAYRPDLAMSLTNLGNRLSELGRREEALAPSQEAVATYRQLAVANPAHVPDLALSLTNLGALLSALGQREEALTPAEEATDLYRRSVEVDRTTHLPGLAAALTNLGALLSRLGRREEALALTEEAVASYRRLAEADPAGRLPDLAMSLTNLGKHLSELGRREEAATASQEATDLYRRLVAANPAAYLPDLALSLTNFSAFLFGLGRREEALAPGEEAVTTYRRLAASKPAAHLPDLARSLSNLGAFLSGLGRRAAALAPAQEATDLYRRLAAANPAAYLPDLAAALTNLGALLLELGREDAVAPTQEAINLYRRLAATHPDAYLPNLAATLNNLGNHLSSLGQREEALEPTQEAVEIRRRLAKANPAAHLPDLATALNNLGARLSHLGRPEEALTASQEATNLYRRLATTNPTAYLPDLAGSLNNLGNHLSGLGRREDALAANQEATDLYRRLAATNPVAYLLDLAMSLNNLGIRLSELARPEEALAAAEEAVNIRRRLSETDPVAHLPDLAGSLNNLGVRLSELARPEEALGSAEDAVKIRRRLAETNPAAHLPDLAAALTNLGNRLSELGRPDEALATTDEAVKIRRRLAEANPVAHLPDLARSLWGHAWVRAAACRDFPAALTAIHEAIDIYQPLAQQVPQRFGRDLSSMYYTLAEVLAGLGRADEAAYIRRQLNEAVKQANDASAT